MSKKIKKQIITTINATTLSAFERAFQARYDDDLDEILGDLNYALDDMSDAAQDDDTYEPDYVNQAVSGFEEELRRSRSEIRSKIEDLKELRDWLDAVKVDRASLHNLAYASAQLSQQKSNHAVEVAELTKERAGLEGALAYVQDEINLKDFGKSMTPEAKKVIATLRGTVARIKADLARVTKAEKASKARIDSARKDAGVKPPRSRGGLHHGKTTKKLGKAGGR